MNELRIEVPWTCGEKHCGECTGIIIQGIIKILANQSFFIIRSTYLNRALKENHIDER
ncbi:MAG: hypothetical protein M0Q91_06365 [Methanoregula sp.]|jgi:ferredoxin|nr:hypothetical protein [Methanoregula sp.]